MTQGRAYKKLFRKSLCLPIGFNLVHRFIIQNAAAPTTNKGRRAERQNAFPDEGLAVAADVDVEV